MRTNLGPIVSKERLRIYVDLAVMGLLVVAESPQEERSFSFRL